MALGAYQVLTISLAFYPGTAQNFRISSTFLFKAHLALERLDGELISFQYIGNMKQYAR